MPSDWFARLNDYYELWAGRLLPGRDEPLWLCCIATSDDGESRAGKVEVEGDLPRRKDI